MVPLCVLRAMWLEWLARFYPQCLPEAERMVVECSCEECRDRHIKPC